MFLKTVGWKAILKYSNFNQRKDLRDKSVSLYEVYLVTHENRFKQKYFFTFEKYPR